MKQKLTPLFLILNLIFSFESASQVWGEIPPATISSNVVRIQADRIEPFYRGYATIQRGGLKAVIDKTGKQILPFGEYYFADDRNTYPQSPTAGPQTDLFVFLDLKTRFWGFITLSGKVHLLKEVVGLKTKFDKKGKCIGTTSKGYVLIDTTGKITPIGNFAIRANENFRKDAELDLIQPSNQELQKSSGLTFHTKGKGFKNYLTDKFRIAPQYDEAQPFEESLAAVMKKDEFGTPRWGFIDTTGKNIIPLKYSIQPGDFSQGLAVVFPSDKREFFAAFIDKQGNEKIKLGTAEYATNENNVPRVSSFFGPGFAYFSGKNSIEEEKILSKDGSVITLSAFVHKLTGLNIPSKSMLRVIAVERNRMFIQAKGDNRATLELDLVNYRHRFIPCPVNMMVINAFNFDEVSGLRHFQSYDRTTGKSTEGYINQANEFVIIVDNTQQW